MTDLQISKILTDMTLIIDTREKKNKNIIDYLELNKIPYVNKKLDSADYSFYLPNYKHLNLDEVVLIEKKQHFDEIIGNFTTNRERFAREFERIEVGVKAHIVIENSTWKKLLNGTYRSTMSSKALMASLFTWNARYNVPIWFCTTDESPTIIYNLLYYGLREHLINIQKNA